jgi:ribosome-binding protein aMBF1 (putative translation factor)
MTAKKKLEHVNRRLTDEERERHAAIREGATQDFPPKEDVHRAAAPTGIPATIREARETRGLTLYALSQLAGIADQATIRDIEQGRDVKLSDVQRVAAALGLKLELVEQVA